MVLILSTFSIINVYRKKFNTLLSSSYSGIMDAEERLTKLGDMLNQLPPVNHEVFLKVMCHFNRSVKYFVVVTGSTCL